MLLILDMDETLITNKTLKFRESIEQITNEDAVETVFKEERIAIFQREYLKEFLQFVFNQFKYVALWSSANKSWIKHVIDNTILSEYENKFIFIWSGEKTSILRNTVRYPYMTRCKKLKKIWRQKKYKDLGIGKHNTIIVDDISKNFVLNYGNGILINEYKINTKDNSLLLLIEFFKKNLLNNPNFDIRKVQNKNNWFRLFDEKDKNDQGNCT